MLARVNRIARAADFRATVRIGRRLNSPHAIVYVLRRGDDAPTRFGFIVSKAVGNSVVRHWTTRRLRAIARDLLPSRPFGIDVIVRALPGSIGASWVTLHEEIFRAILNSGAQKGRAQ